MRGFTLIEVMVVIALATILVTLAGPNLLGMYRRSSLSAEGRRLYGAFVEAQGQASATGNRHQLKVDRANKTWEIREDANGDGVFERLVKQHPKSTDGWPGHIAFGPVAGTTAAFPSPYNGISHDAWCSPCGAAATSGEIRFDVDGRVLDTSDEVVVPGGSILLHDTSTSSGKSVQALVFVGATGNVRLFSMTE